MATEKSAIKIAQPNRQVLTVFITTTNSATGEERGVEKKLNLAFNPQEMVLRQVTWSGIGAVGEMNVINSDIHKDCTLATFSGAADGVIAPASSFNLLSRPSTVRFWVTENGTTTFSSFVGTIALTLEFRG